MTASCDCGRRWTGTAEAHCPVCHAHFSTVSNFDRHRPVLGPCDAPEDAGLVAHTGPHGVTYRMPVDEKAAARLAELRKAGAA